MTWRVEQFVGSLVDKPCRGWIPVTRHTEHPTKVKATEAARKLRQDYRYAERGSGATLFRVVRA